MTQKRTLGLICVAVLCGILWLGLRPFEKPKNDASWLGSENGLRFNGYGTIFSTEQFEMTLPPERASSSLEIWMRPGLTFDTNTFLAFSTPENPLQFSLHQYLSNMILERRIPNVKKAIIGIEGVFNRDKPLFLAITSGPAGTTLYVDGHLAKSFSGFCLGNALTGQLVIGTSPVRTDGWLGDLKGLAVYDRELTEGEVLQHFESWKTRGAADVPNDGHVTALYLFDQRAGRIVRNAAHTGLDLYIPRRFSLLHQPFLKPFWKEYSLSWRYFRDCALNVLAFVPLGFFFCAYWRIARPMQSADLMTVVLGFAVSLTVELLQAYLPTRNSGMTDLFTNTLGTFVGVRLFSSNPLQTLLVKLPGRSGPV